MLPSVHRCLVAAVAVLLLLALLPGPSAARDDTTIVGADGATYPAAPLVIEGRRGDLFYGGAFDRMCSDAGPGLAAGMRRLGRLATLIRRSGRDVVFTVVPDKALVNRRTLVRSRIPHGACGRTGLAQQGKVLDRFEHPSYLPLRTLLAGAAEQDQVFWRTDVHWNTFGTAVYAKALATRLSARIGQRQRYKPGRPQTMVGALNQFLGDPTPETVPSLTPRTAVEVTPVEGTDSLDQAFPIDHAWTATPAALTYPGRTLLVGDSFTAMALDNLRPVFRKGRFLWVVNNPDRKIAKAIGRSDTVVLEVVQFFTGHSPLGTPSFRRLVQRAVRG